MFGGLFGKNAGAMRCQKARDWEAWEVLRAQLHGDEFGEWVVSLTCEGGWCRALVQKHSLDVASFFWGGGFWATFDLGIECHETCERDHFQAKPDNLINTKIPGLPNRFIFQKYLIPNTQNNLTLKQT